MTYDSAVVDRDILYSHTDRSSELENDSANATPAEDRTTLSGEQGLYDDLGLSSSSLSGQLTDMVNSEDYQNPMSGYIMTDPEEILLGSVGSKSGGSKDHRPTMVSDLTVTATGWMSLPMSVFLMMGGVHTAFRFTSGILWKQVRHHGTHAPCSDLIWIPTILFWTFLPVRQRDTRR